MSPAEWRAALARLRRAKLLAEEDPHQPGQVDAHPLVREYFGEQLRHELIGARREGNRRLYDHYRALAPERPESIRAMEPLFLAVTCACQAGLLRDALHQVYLPRIQRGQTSFAAKTLGARGALLSALAHFFEPGRWGSVTQTAVEGQNLPEEDQLFILLQTTMYLTATRGFAAPEARVCSGRVESLCHSLHRPLPLYAASMSQWRYSLATDRLTTTLQLAQRIYALAQGQNDAALLIGADRALATTLFYMGEFESARQRARRGIELWRRGVTPSAVEEVHEPVVLCLCWQALADWHLGEIASCHASMADAISLAKALNDTHALAMALGLSAGLSYLEGHPAEVERLASEMIELSTRQSFAVWQHMGEALSGWARSVSVTRAEGLAWIERGIDNLRATGWMLYQPVFLALKAEALHLAGRTSEALETVKEADALVERSEERWWSAELQRLRGVFLATLGADDAHVEAAFHEALRTAKQQKSIPLMKRIEASHARDRSQRRAG